MLLPSPHRQPSRPVAVAVRFLFALLLLCATSATAQPAAERPYAVTETRDTCEQFDPQRRPFFGDTHVHTTHSQDASTQNTRVTPADAYRFAKGEPLGIQPYDAQGNAMRTVALTRPLDFAVVTDHAEQIGEVHVCKTPDLPGYGSLVCRLYRNFPRASFFIMNGKYAFTRDRWGFCGEGGEHCLDAARTIWQSTQAAAETAYDRSDACTFTSFVGYEWTASPMGAHLHRNVIFRNAEVPDLPISVMETDNIALELWTRLAAECEGAGGACEAITIPHNSNIGGGYTFTSAAELGKPIEEKEVALRARYDRLAEIMQAKGASECAMTPGVTDEACDFEIVQIPEFVPFRESPPPASIDYVRSAIARGLSLEQRFGTNPLKYGVIGSTDTHLGTPGLTEERGHPGHGGAGKPARDALPVGLTDNLEYNAGGLAVVWAEENTRDALFAAMHRREVYGTSGTRPVLRFFAGYDYTDTLCGAPDLATQAYAGGVPMGGSLPAPPRPGARPRFIVSAQRDPADSASPLQELQVVKLWIEAGERKQAVFSVAGGENGAQVDTATCAQSGPGNDQLCGVWLDPEFDPNAPAAYYARILENPSCRWSQWACVDAGVVCDDPASIGPGFEPCCDAAHKPVIRERAWSSSIWYTPEAK
jgi:hypothetical protein